jgi:DNA-binding XRE family transcriptional regulator
VPTKSYNKLHEKVIARPGAAERLAALRDDTLAEIGLYELRKALERSQTDLAALLDISQSAVSQLERGQDIKLSTLRSYLEKLGARLELFAVFEEDDDEVEVPIRIGDVVRH